MNPTQPLLHRQRLNGVWLSLNLALLSSNPAWPQAWLRHSPHYAETLKDPEQAKQLFSELNKLAVDQTRDLIAGIRLYQQSPVHRAPEMNDIPVVWERGTTRLLDYGQGSSGPPVLVVPSLINRFDIMDIDAPQSFLRYLAAQGLRPLVIDWTSPGDDELDLSIGGYITERLVPALYAAQAYGSLVHVMGYCLGGILALALACLKPEDVRSLTLLATPWHTGKTTVDDTTDTQKTLLASSDLFLKLVSELEKPLAKLNYLPVSILQMLFACVQPSYAIRKFAAFSKRDPDSAAARLFVLTEDWLNDGIPLTAPVTRELMGDIYGRNVTGKIQWKVGDTLIDPRKLNMPTALVIAAKDKIVPRESALPLGRLIRGAKLFQPTLGHVGLMVGRTAPTDVWQPLTQWLTTH